MQAASSDPAQTSGTPLRDLPLPEVVRRCGGSFRKDASTEGEQDTFRYELFRRAVSERDEQAWEALLVQFRGFVLANIRRHPWVPASGDNEYWINRTFERLWQAVGPERFVAFPDLPSVLGYLKACIHSVVVNEVRTSHRTLPAVPLDEATEEPGQSDEVERDVLDQLAVTDLWAVVNAELQNDDERLIAHLSFVLDMKPAEIQALYADRFPTMAHMYRVKRNVIDRLRRSERLRELLE